MSDNPNEPITASTQTNDPVFTSGDKLAGRFVLKDPLRWGHPGLSAWAAFDDAASKDVILLFAPPVILRDAALAKELRHLVRLNRRLIHPGVIRIYDYIEESQWAAIVMDSVEGTSLETLRLAREKQSFEPGEATPWIHQLCQTLRDASRIGLLHLDLAPANLILSESGALHVANFRISRFFLDVARKAQGHGPDECARLSPQLLEGAAPSPADDVYSLGILLFELLAGRLPFTTGNIPEQVRDVVPPLLSEVRKGVGAVPDDWDRTIAACLEKEPSRRPDSVTAVAEMVGGKKNDQGTVLASPVPKIQGLPPVSPTPPEHPAIPTQPTPAPATRTPAAVPLTPVPLGANGVTGEKSRFPGLAVAAVVILLALIAAAVFLSNRPSEPISAPAPTPAPFRAQPSPSAVAKPSPSVPMASAAVVDKEKLRTEWEDARKDLAVKSNAVATGKQVADELAGLIKPLREEQMKAETDAHAAQEVAAQKAHTADVARKAVADAEEKGKAAADALPQLKKDLQEAQRAVSERRLVAQAAGALSGEDAAGAVAAGSGAAVSPTPPAPAPSASPGKPGKSPTLSILAVNQKASVSKTLVNSLGMRFSPVGNVLFGVWPVRLRDFSEFAKASGFSSSAWKDPGFEQAPDHPVVYVSWDDAMSFCKWLTEKERKEGMLSANQYYRLPTDLEWSKAVGLQEEAGGTPETHDMDVSGVFPWGTQWPPPPRSGNYTGEETNSEVAIHGYNDGYAWTSPVGAFPPNKLGLYDMGGNVSQWVMDSWNSEQRAKVLRGGSWYNGALRLSLLSSCRVHAPPETSTDNWGFRVVVAPLKTGGN